MEKLLEKIGVKMEVAEVRRIRKGKRKRSAMGKETKNKSGR